MILTHLQFDRYKHSKHPEELKNLKQSELEQPLIASIDQFGLVCKGNSQRSQDEAGASSYWI